MKDNNGTHFTLMNYDVYLERSCSLTKIDPSFFVFSNPINVKSLKNIEFFLFFFVILF